MIKKRIPVILITLLIFTASGCGDSLKSITLSSSKATKTAEARESTQNGQDQAPDCPLSSPHPVAKSIAEKYEQKYQDVVEWYCAGYSFEEILVALQTSRLADLETLELLERAEEDSWFEIWEDLDLNP